MANNRLMNASSIVLVILWVLSIPALPVIAVWKYIGGHVQLSVMTLVVWLISFVSYYFYLKAHRKAEKAMELQKEIENQKIRKEYLEERKREGILKLDDRYALVDSSKWDNDWNNCGQDSRHDWLEGEARQLLPDDKVYEYNFGGGGHVRCGYVIFRKGKIVAAVCTLESI